MTSVIARIVLRYAAGALVAAGYLDADFGNQLAVDPDVLMLVGTGFGIGVEPAYAVARRLGWAT